MAAALAKGQRMEIRGLCAFKIKDYPEYTGRNPKTSERVTVKPNKLPFFKPGLDLKKRVDRWLAEKGRGLIWIRGKIRFNPFLCLPYTFIHVGLVG